MNKNSNAPRPRCTIQLDAIDVAHLNLFKCFDEAESESIAMVAAERFVRLIGEEIIARSREYECDPLELLDAAETALAVLDSAFTHATVEPEAAEYDARDIPDEIAA